MSEQQSEITRKILQKMMDDGDVSRADIAKEFDITRQAVGYFLNGDHDILLRYVRICEMAGYDVILRKKYLEINLTKAISEEE